MTALAAFFAMSETALTRVSRIKANSLAEDGRKGAAPLKRLADRPESFITPLLLLVLLCHLIISTLLTLLVEGPFGIGPLRVTPFDQQHGLGNVTTGYRLGRMAYSTDVVALNEAAFEVLADLDLWIVDCLRFEPHPTHAHFDLTMSWIERLKPKRALLTHLNHMIDYDVLAARCPPGVEPAYDGLSVEIPD